MVDALEKALANKSKAINGLAELRSTIDRCEQERRSAIDNLAKIAQSNGNVSVVRDERKCEELTAELDRLDAQVKEWDDSVRTAQESLKQANSALLQYLEQPEEIAN